MMNMLPKKFGKNGLTYNLLERTDKWCLFETECSYEVMKVKMRNSGFKIGEGLPSNEEFGREGSKCWGKKDYKYAKSYYDSKN